MSATAREHVIDPAKIHHRWQKELEPALVIRSGDVVHFDLLAAGDGQVHEGARFEETSFDFETIYNLSGPIFVEDAEPGDALEIEILELAPGDWGWTAVLPEVGLLPDDFPEPYLRTFDLRDGDRVRFAPGIELPFSPFLGTMGNHPGEPDGELPFPPHRGGGNMDNRHLTQGTALWLPIWLDGALFSCGDPHAMQGDGEVCVAALECPMSASLRFHLHKSWQLEAPQFRTAGALTPRTDAAGYHGTMGISPDLMEGARAAVRAMIAWLGDEHGLSREDAYVLCSLAGDLKIHEIVDAGVWNVGMTIPLAVFTAGS